ncbi:hypothetical protein Pfo_027257 [Paulownia fortunei]|nr:hypothetical protein Pfo_027257 [Paulownia fortunei]
MERKAHLAASLIQENHAHSKDVEYNYSSGKRVNHDHMTRTIWKRCSFKWIFIACTLWMSIILVALLFHVLPCQFHDNLFSVSCFEISKVPAFSRNGGSVPIQQHRCSIPLSNDPNRVYIPKIRSSDSVVKNLTYIMEDDLVSSNGSRHFHYLVDIKVHCGFMRNSGAEMTPVDMKYVKRCKFLVASGIFGEYDIPRQPFGISARSKKIFYFLMMVDEKGHWMGAWRFILLRHLPYDEPRRNGKIPKILIHRLVPQAQYSIWVDAKMTLIVDPLLILERFLWREGHTFAIAQHRYHRSVYEEADANKRRKRYCHPLIDHQTQIYYHEGMEPWSSKKNTISDVLEGAIIMREHTNLNNLFSCLWFNEVDLFTPRDQMSFGYVVYRIGDSFKFFMFPNSCNKHDGNYSKLKETRGGLGLWSHYPADLDLIVLPPVVRTSKAG